MPPPRSTAEMEGSKSCKRPCFWGRASEKQVRGAGVRGAAAGAAGAAGDEHFCGAVPNRKITAAVDLGEKQVPSKAEHAHLYGNVTLSQEHYVNTRLQTVDIPKKALLEDQADEVAKMDNQSTIGALSWLASQTRPDIQVPDIQVGVLMAQRKQKSPTYEDIKATNHVVRMAQKEKNEKLVYNKLGNWNDLAIIMYHDAAWANVTNEYDHVDYVETKDAGIYSQLGYVVVIAHRDALLGKPGAPLLLTMAALDGWEAGIAFRDLLRGCFRAGCPAAAVHDRLQESVRLRAPRWWPARSIGEAPPGGPGGSEASGAARGHCLEPGKQGDFWKIPEMDPNGSPARRWLD
ncbi:Copia protein [Durusdinium trenchii]|uniref:Copia protein n=1 Tax=Durusdinium trenchii TaxID=1381693 RepID=A0ABP0P1M6_9DINO